MQCNNMNNIKILMPDVMKIEYNTRVLQEAASLIKNKYDVHVLGFSNMTKTFKSKTDSIPCYSYYLSDYRSGIKKISRYLTALKMLLGVNLFIVRHRFDVYHAHNFHVLPAAVIAAKIRRKKVVYDTHETWTIHHNKKNHPEHILAFIVEKLFLQFVDGFITVNEMIVDYYRKKYGLKEGIVLYNTRPILPLAKSKLIHKEIGIDGNKRIVLFQGGFWGKSRGIFELIEAAQYINSNAVIILLGYGSPEHIKQIKEKILLYKLDEKVMIMPAKSPDELLKYTMSADIGVNLINRVGKAQDFQSPWKLFEYCMAGLAVVSTDLPFHRKVHEKYKIGPLIGTMNNSNEIAEAINDLINSPNRLRQYQKNARNAAEKEFNWETQEKKLLRLYEEIMNG